ncbi:unnamed protein product [Cuscuta campestris]|uniref:Uncharacterized protein n=1 Tax=Cuscuta campestris TaxID=132261 RepID=A0A484M7R2_9ASTE|nr:unnamed protein product [Cuscuta campestris]
MQDRSQIRSQRRLPVLTLLCHPPSPLRRRQPIRRAARPGAWLDPDYPILVCSRRWITLADKWIAKRFSRTGGVSTRALCRATPRSPLTPIIRRTRRLVAAISGGLPRSPP